MYYWSNVKSKTVKHLEKIIVILYWAKIYWYDAKSIIQREKWLNLTLLEFKTSDFWKGLLKEWKYKPQTGTNVWHIKDSQNVIRKQRT